MGKLFFFVLVVFWNWLNNSPAWAIELPIHIKRCVEETATSIRYAKSADDLEKKLSGQIQENAVGLRTYKYAWRNMDDATKKAGIAMYVKKLYKFGVGAGANGSSILSITATRLDRIARVVVYLEGGKKVAAYNVVVEIRYTDKSGKNKTTTARVLSTNDCKFADVGIVEGSSEVWVSGLLTSDDIPR